VSAPLRHDAVMAVTGTARIFGLLSSLVRAIASVIGGLILVHAVFVLFGANHSNVLVQFTAGIRDSFGWFTKNLFQPSDHKIGEAINDALAGFIWVFLGSLVAKFIARLAPAGKAKDKSSKNDTPRSTPVQKSQPAEKPKQEAPVEPAPAAEAEAPKEEAPKAQAAEVRDEPAPEPVAQDAEEPGSSAKHQATTTAREEDRAEARAEDKAQA
jgi:zinc transporter ZupT